MGMEIPGVIPTGLHTDYTQIDSNKVVRVPKKQQKPQPAIDIREAVKNLEKMVIQFNRRFEITVNENINRIVVKVIDTETDKVIKEIPPEEIQNLLYRLNEMMGLLINEKI